MESPINCTDSITIHAPKQEPNNNIQIKNVRIIGSIYTPLKSSKHYVWTFEVSIVKFEYGNNRLKSTWVDLCKMNNNSSKEMHSDDSKY